MNFNKASKKADSTSPINLDDSNDEEDAQIKQKIAFCCDEYIDKNEPKKDGIIKRKRTFEKKEVAHHSLHNHFQFKSGENHTHYKKYIITREEQRSLNNDKEDWKIIPESEEKRFIGGGIEEGHTDPYMKFLD